MKLASAAPGVLRRAAKRKAAFDRDLAEPAAAWAGEMDQPLVPGSFMTEVVSIYRRSRTLILIDLIERSEVDKARADELRLFMRLGGITHPKGVRHALYA